jgi:ABC-type Fe3+-citrate transport system substrate-binding protein
MPYSLKVRKRIAKEVAKRAEAEQRIAELEENLKKLKEKLLICK